MINTYRRPAPGRRQTHCPQGHPYDLANTYKAPGSIYPQCLTCRIQRNAERDRSRPPRNPGMPPQGTAAYQRERRARIKAGTWVSHTPGYTAAEDRVRKARQDEITHARESRQEARREARWEQEQEENLRRVQTARESITAELSSARPGSLKQRRLIEALNALPPDDDADDDYELSGDEPDELP